MTKEEYIEHRKDWHQKKLSSDAFVLFSNIYVDSLELRTCESCRYCDKFRDDIIHCDYFEQFLPTEIGSCKKWSKKDG